MTKICYYVHDLNFPIVEGIRKEAWFLAKSFQGKGYDITILSTSNKKMIIKKDGIRIIYGNLFDISKHAYDVDVLHIISHPTVFVFPLLSRTKAKKIIVTCFDGELAKFWERPWYFLSKYLSKRINVFTVQTKYQKKIVEKFLPRIKTMIIPPMIPNFKQTKKKSKTPRILFMSYFGEKKGFYDLLKACKHLHNENIGLVLADSQLKRRAPGIHKKINDIKKKCKLKIVLKGVVNPEDELSKSWIYVYPIQTPLDSFSIPISLFEAYQTNTLFLVSNVGGINEYVDENYLFEPKNVKELAKILGYYLNQFSENRDKTIKKLKKEAFKIEVNNDTIAKQFESIYFDN